MSVHHRLAVSLCLLGGCLFDDPGPVLNATGGAGPTGPGEEDSSSVTQATTGAEAPTTGADATTEPDATDETGAAQACTWEQVLTDQRPFARIDAAMALAPGRDEVLLYGGRVGLIGGDLDDTWAFDGERWRQVYSGDGDEGDDGDDEDDGEGKDHPGPRRGHAMAYDAARDRVVLFGGERGNLDVKLANDTWTHDGGGWTKRGSGPSLRAYTAMADFPRGQVVLLFGGRTDKGPDGETWAWDGKNWTRVELAPMMAPSPRFGHVMSVDGAGDVLLYGGCGDPLCGKPLVDTWRFDGVGWTRVDPGMGMGVRAGAMTHDSGQAQTLRLGMGQSWSWVGTAWAGAGAAEPALSHFVVADLPGTGVVLFGGLSSQVVENDTTWVRRCP